MKPDLRSAIGYAKTFVPLRLCVKNVLHRFANRGSTRVVAILTCAVNFRLRFMGQVVSCDPGTI
jgi:hypothetical protein